MTLRSLIIATSVLVLLGTALPVLAQGLPVLNVASEAGGNRYSVTLELVVLMTLLTLLPTLLLMMTPFVRVIIVFSLLRQALGTGQTPPNQVLVGLALFLSFFIMAPVLQKVYDDAAVPYLEGRLQIGRAHV